MPGCYMTETQFFVSFFGALLATSFVGRLIGKKALSHFGIEINKDTPFKTKAMVGVIGSIISLVILFSVFFLIRFFMTGLTPESF